MKEIIIHISASYPSTNSSTETITTKIQTRGLDHSIKEKLEKSEDFKRVIKGFYFHPGIIATNNKASFYINVKGIKRKGNIEIQLKSNLEEVFNDPVEKRAIEFLISPNKGLINIIIYNILKSEKYVNIDQIISVPIHTKVYDAKNTKIIREMLKNKGKIITSTYFGELNVSTPTSFLSFEISTFSNMKDKTVISIVAKGYDKTFSKLSPALLIEEIKNFAQNIPFNELPKPLYNYIVGKFIFDQENDLVFIAKNIGKSFTLLTSSDKALEDIIKSIKENEIAYQLFLILLPLLIETKKMKVGTEY